MLIFRAVILLLCLAQLVQAAVFPLKVSANGRYLTDQNNAPFLIVGDSPQSMFANLSLADAEIYLANRQRYGFNALLAYWTLLACFYYSIMDLIPIEWLPAAIFLDDLEFY